MAEVSLDAHGVVPGSVEGRIQRAAQDHPTSAAQDWIASIEKSNLTPRYYATIGLMVLQEMFEFYDFFLVGYLVSVLAPGWHLTYGQSAMMLLSSGVGAIAGSLFGGLVADREAGVAVRTVPGPEALLVGRRDLDRDFDRHLWRDPVGTHYSIPVAEDHGA